MPKEIEDYVHQIGRTGRSGKTGIATTFVNSGVQEQTLLDLKYLLMEAKQRYVRLILSNGHTLIPICSQGARLLELDRGPNGEISGTRWSWQSLSHLWRYVFVSLSASNTANKDHYRSWSFRHELSQTSGYSKATSGGAFSGRSWRVLISCWPWRCYRMITRCQQCEAVVCMVVY